ncbi:MAG: DUF3179 domain-containing protein [Parvularculaceae bacterium]
MSLPALIRTALSALFLAAALGAGASAQIDRAQAWSHEWPQTDFSRHAVPLREIESNVPKDAIRSIDNPEFTPVSNVILEGVDELRFAAAPRGAGRRLSERTLSLSPRDPVISLKINGDARAYPLRILMYHEIVNDVVGGRPVVVTFCPLCNAAIVFDRQLDGRAVEFGTTGKLRNSDLVMYDRASESWWQQFTGRAIVGAHTGRKLERLAARLDSFDNFAARHPDGRVLIPSDPTAAPYGKNPYLNYDRARRPFLYRGDLPEGIRPLARVVAVGDVAYSLKRVREKGVIEENGVRIAWSAGQASALDRAAIAESRDVGTVVVQEKTPEGGWRDIPYDVTFAFAFHAFNPDGEWRL